MTESANETNAAQRQRTLRETTRSATTEFDALLAGLHVVAQPSLDGPVLRESQMFDAPEREGGGRLEPRDDAGALADQSDRSRTDVRARRAAAESSTRATQQADPAPSKSPPPRGTTERVGEALPDQSRRGVEPETHPNRAPLEPAARNAQASASKESTPVAPSDAGAPVATAQRVSVAGQTRPADGADNRAQSAAKTIGRVLGTSQSTGVETPRGSGAGQGTLNQGKTAAEKSATPSQAPPKQEAARESSFARMVKSLRMSTGPRNSSATIRLEPERLGRMHVQVKMSGDRISIEVRTETSEARDLVASRAMDLRSALEQQGLRIERFDVRSDLAEEGAADRPFGPRSDERGESGASKRGSRRDALGASSAVSDQAPVADEAQAVDGEDMTVSPEAASAHLRHVDIRV